MKKPPLIPCALVLLAGAVLYLGWDAFEAKEDERPFTLLERARALRIEESDDTALIHSMLTRALDQSPGAALELELLRERADLREATGAPALARDDYARLAELQPDDLALLQKLAGLHKQLGEDAVAEAIWADLLERQPGNGWFRSQAMMIELEGWQAALDELEDELAVYLSQKDLLELRPALMRLVHLPAADPATRGLLADFEATLPEPAFQHIAIEAPRLRILLQEIRAEFAASLKGGANRNNLYAIIDSLYAAERLTGVVDFGLAAVAFDAADTHPGIIQELALALNRLDRPLAATLAVNSVQGKDVQWYADFLDGWCEILYAAENWPQLFNAADLMTRQAANAGSEPIRLSNGRFYRGIAAFELGRDEEAVGSLRGFIGGHLEGPHAGAVGRAFDACTTALERLDRTGEAQNMLVAWSNTAPESSPRPWLFRADRAAADTARSLAEAGFLAHAMNADPALTEELLVRFETAGAAGLTESAIDITNIAFQSRASGRWYPAGDVAPFTLYALAEHYLGRNQPAGADLVLGRLLRDLPTFLPAHDLRGIAHLLMGDELEYADVLLTRLELSGPHEPTQAALRDLANKLEGRSLPGDLLRRWMEMDPGFIGAIEITKQLVDDGHDVQAFTTMNAIDRLRFTESDRLLYCEVLISLGRFELILPATEPIGPKSEAWVERNVLRVLAAARTNDFQALDAALGALEAVELEWDADSATAEHADLAFEALLASPADDLRARFVRLLASAPGVRTGERMNQAALVEVLAGNPAEAEAWLVRADGLSTTGAPLAGRLILAVLADDETRIARAVRDLRREAPPWTGPHTPAYLAGLEQRYGEARALVEAGLQADPTAARLWLASAALDALAGVSPASANANVTTIPGREPTTWLGPDAAQRLPRIAGSSKAFARRVLTLLLAADAPVWNAWSANRAADRTFTELLGPFAAELQLELALGAGRADLTDLGRARERFPTYVPFWDLYADMTLELVGREDHPDLLAVRRERRAAGVPPRGGQQPSAVELALDASWTATDEGRPAIALARAREAAQAAPEQPAVQLTLARAARDIAPAEAQTAYVAYLLAAPLARDERSVVLGELLGLGRVLDDSQLEALLDAQPDAPELVLASALKAMTQPAQLNAELARLERFARNHPALEDLSPGASRRWFDAFARYAPDRALALAEQQLEKNPRHLGPWIQRAEALDLLGERQAALELLRTVTRMAPDPRGAIAHADLLASLGGPHEEVTATLNLARRSPDLASFADQLEFIATKSLANIGGNFVGQAVERMQALVTKPELAGVERSAVRRRLGITLLHRAQPGDGARALPHLEASQANARDPLDRDLVLALTNLARRLDAELESQAAANPVD